MQHAFVTIAIPFDASRTEAVEKALETYRTFAPLEGEGASDDIARPLDDAKFIHFMSITVIAGETESKSHLVIEASADGTVRSVIERLAEAIGKPLQEILQQANLWPVNDPLARFLEGHHHNVGQGWFSTPGLCFDGTPLMSVSRIRREQKLARTIANLLEKNEPFHNALAALEHVRRELWNELGEEPDSWERTGTKWAFRAAPTPWLQDFPSLAAGFGMGFLSGVATFLWPFLLVIAAAAVLIGNLYGGWSAFWTVLILSAAGFVWAAWLYGRLRKLEKTDIPGDRTPPADKVAEFLARESNRTRSYRGEDTYFAHGHLAACSTMKPGRLRRFTLRIGLWIAGVLARHFSHPGDLATTNVIHFARWIMLPGTDKLVFLSNYDGAWESYIENFVELAAKGVTGIWSNTRDFPRSEDLFFKGGTDGTRLRRFVRNQQYASRIWYSAYPGLTLTRIRKNAMIRRGVALAKTEAEAADWLSHFGSAPAPATFLEADQIQTLVYGGLKPLRFGTCLLLNFSDKDGAAGKWLGAVKDRVSFGPIGTDTKAMVLALSKTGLEKLGLKSDAMATFPVPFQHGMDDEPRAAALGDTGENAPQEWFWGNSGSPVDGLLLLYTRTAKPLEGFARATLQMAEKYGHSVQEQPLTELPRNGPIKEWFGFVDGISQPIIRGGPKPVTQDNRNHVVEPGEFILGYADNLGYLPASPSIAAADDADNLLPALGSDPYDRRPSTAQPQPDARRDFGRNGSYLVVRQLEQDISAFNAFISEQAKTLRGDDRVPPGTDPAEWIAAKMVGRWKNGSPLVRRPDRPAAVNPVDRQNEFLFGTEDPSGLRCPFGAHIRRVNPRESFDPGSQSQLDISNRHRILRVGRLYGQEGSLSVGLMFMCLNADIERQFEFVQQTWALARNFHGLENEPDPLLGGQGNTMTIPTRTGPLVLRGLTDFIRLQGGGYFFLPGRCAMEFLAR